MEREVGKRGGRSKGEGWGRVRGGGESVIR